MHNAIAHFVGLVSCIIWVVLETRHFSSSWKFSSQCPVIEEDELKFFHNTGHKKPAFLKKHVMRNTTPFTQRFEGK